LLILQQFSVTFKIIIVRKYLVQKRLNFVEVQNLIADYLRGRLPYYPCSIENKFYGQIKKIKCKEHIFFFILIYSIRKEVTFGEILCG